MVFYYGLFYIITIILFILIYLKIKYTKKYIYLNSLNYKNDNIINSSYKEDTLNLKYTKYCIFYSIKCNTINNNEQQCAICKIFLNKDFFQPIINISYLQDQIIFKYNLLCKNCKNDICIKHNEDLCIKLNFNRFRKIFSLYLKSLKNKKIKYYYSTKKCYMCSKKLVNIKKAFCSEQCEKSFVLLKKFNNTLDIIDNWLENEIFNYLNQYILFQFKKKIDFCSYCNNNLEKITYIQCTKCKLYNYCQKKCQLKHNHKNECILFEKVLIEKNYSF